MSFDVDNDAAVKGGISVNGAEIRPTTSIRGKTKAFEQTHSVKDRSGKIAQTYVKVVNAPSDLYYNSEILPNEGKLRTIQPWLSAEQWLSVSRASSIISRASAIYGGLSTDAGLEMVKGPLNTDFVALTNYYGKAYASDGSDSSLPYWAGASQNAESAAGNSIQIYGHANDGSGPLSIDTTIHGISGSDASFRDLDASSSAGTFTQTSQKVHVTGDFSSTATSGSGAKTRESNYGTEFDLDMQAIKGSAPTGTLGYYVNPGMTNLIAGKGAIEGAASVVESGDTINAASGTYSEDLDQSLFDNIWLVGEDAATTHTKSFNLNKPLNGRIAGITGDTVNVTNPNAKIQDGVDLVTQGGTLNLASGTYVENVQIDKSLKVIGAGASNTIVDGNQTGSVFSIGMSDPSIDVSLSGMTVQNGDSEKGGGIFNKGRLTVTDSAVSSNIAQYGGGIYSLGTLNVVKSTISNNNAIQEGGAIYNYGATTVIDSSILGNRAGVGGGLFNWQGKISAINADMINNFAGYGGGGIFNYDTLEMTNSRITDNTATWGGGVSNVGEATIEDSLISRNTATQKGGGINNEGTVTVVNSSITHSTAHFDGGGIYNNGGALTLNGVAISNNRISNGYGQNYHGGGIYSNDGIMNIYSSYIDHNTAEDGAGIYSKNGMVNMSGSSISYNIGSSGGGIYSNGGIVNMYDSSIDHNDISSMGSGIYNLYGSVNMFKGSSINSNDAMYGGGVWNDNGIVNMYSNSSINNNLGWYGGGIWSDEGRVNMYDGASITGNSAGSHGGGIYSTAGSTVTMNEGSSISGNSAILGGGIYNDGYIWASAVIMNGGNITGNTASNGVGIASTGNVILNKPLGAIDPSYSDTVTVNNGAKLQDGVNLASSGGRVNVGAGTYYENVQINRSLTMAGFGAPKDQIIVDGDTNNDGDLTKEGSVFTIGSDANRNLDVTLSTLTITGGTGTSISVNDNDGTKYVSGGGILNYGSLTITDSMISNNTAYYGGGIFSQGTVKLNSGTSVTQNNAYHGGGIYNSGGGGSIATVNLKGGSLVNNHATAYGAGIYSGGCYIGRNIVNLYNESTISANTAENSGGGISIFSEGTLNMYGGNISENRGWTGGGIYSYGGHVYLNGGNIYSNEAMDGAGVENGGGWMTLNGALIYGNTAKKNNYGYGGGVMNSGILTLTNGSIDHNTAFTDGGGIWNNIAGTISGDKGLVHDNTLTSGTPDDISP